MEELKFTLIADGSSDKTLLIIIKWTLDDLFPKIPNLGTYADFRHLPKPPKGLKEKIKAANKYYPFDLLFIHRDAEKTDLKIINQRVSEIKKEIDPKLIEITIPVIPIKMMESWLLINKDAILKAAGNRNYRGEINLPEINKIETEKQPKIFLHKILEEASGLKGRKLKNFNINKAIHFVAENIEDFSVLRELEAFKVFELELKQKMESLSPLFTG